MSNLILGGSGLVGSNLKKYCDRNNLTNMSPSSSELDLLSQSSVQRYFKSQKIQTVFMCAGRVGGIKANSTRPYQFIQENALMIANLIDACLSNRIEKLIYLGSSCLYPPTAELPFKEESLLSAPFEKTNEWYAIAKTLGIKLCAAARIEKGLDARVIMPTNLYGRGDNYHPEDSHVIAALVKKFCDAKRKGDMQVNLWGSGEALREVMHVDDLAASILHVATIEQSDFEQLVTNDLPVLNSGSGQEYSIAQLAKIIAKKVGYDGEIKFDQTKEGVKRKLMDSSKLLSVGFECRIRFEEGIHDSIEDYANNFFNVTA